MPLILIIFNQGLIPLLIDLVAKYEDHETQSAKQLTILRLNYFFMLLNTILLPLTGYITIKDFLNYALKALEK